MAETGQHGGDRAAWRRQAPHGGGKRHMAEASAATTIHFPLPTICEAAWEGRRHLRPHTKGNRGGGAWHGGGKRRHAHPHRSVGCLRKMWVMGRLYTHDGHNVYSSGCACLSHARPP